MSQGPAGAGGGVAGGPNSRAPPPNPAAEGLRPRRHAPQPAPPAAGAGVGPRKKHIAARLAEGADAVGAFVFLARHCYTIAANPVPSYLGLSSSAVRCLLPSLYPIQKRGAPVRLQVSAPLPTTRWHLRMAWCHRSICIRMHHVCTSSKLMGSSARIIIVLPSIIFVVPPSSSLNIASPTPPTHHPLPQLTLLHSHCNSHCSTLCE